MLTFLNIFATIVQFALTVTSYAMAARMILPLFLDPEDSRLYLFTCLLSEPLVAPVRFLLSIFGIGDNSPIDWSLPTAYLLLFVIRLLLPEL